MTGLRYDHMTKATIRRLLQNKAVEYIVCMEEVEDKDGRRADDDRSH